MSDNGKLSNLSIHDLPEAERPRERLLTSGATVLSNTELLAILLRTGTKHENAIHLAERILAECGGLGGLARTSTSELHEIAGLGDAKITQILAAIELGKRAHNQKSEKRPHIKNASDAAQLVIDMSHLQREEIRVILLDSSQRVLAIPTVYIGTVNAAMLRTAELFREAITRNAPAMIVAHNHPAGDPTPSPEDIRLTRKLLDAGRLLDIVLLDHIIIADNDWRSLKELNLGF